MRLIFVLTLCLFTVSAQAVDVPQTSRRDNRIQYVNYHDGDVVMLHATTGIVSRIVFEPGESVISVHSGFTDGWDITTSGRIMTVQPISVTIDQDTTVRPSPEEWDTNIAVETTRRLYDFDVRLVPEQYSKAAAPVFYRVEFRYPIEKAESIRKEVEQEYTSDLQRSSPIPRNHEYSMRLGKRSQGIAPTMAFDDGLFTYLRFPGNRDFPTVFIVDAEGQESKVNTHVHESAADVLVIHRVANEFVLRLGKQVVAVENNRFDPEGQPPIDGSTVPGVTRLIKIRRGTP